MDKPTPVVTSFIVNADKILLLKRSERVGTYKGSWTAVSGFVERLPLDQAYVEIQEEAGLQHSEVTLQGIGIPIIVDDPDLNRCWMVHPFLFQTDAPSKITTDWETSEVRWIDSADLPELAVVPGLDRALASVWPPFTDSEFWATLSGIATDTVHGATSLALSGLQALDSLLQRNPSTPYERAVRAFAACRSSMGVFPHLAARLLLDNPPVPELISSLTKATADSAAQADEGLRGYTRILTNSYSSAVRDTLVRRNTFGGELKVVVAESRPGLEGITLARELAGQGIDVTVITDAQVGVFTGEVDAVLVGCDAITADDRLQNKAGTSLIAFAAAASGIPCFAVTQTFKIMPPGFPHTLEEQDPDAIGHCDGLRFRNVIFDQTQLSLFTTVYTENGALDSDTLADIRMSLSAAKL